MNKKVLKIRAEANIANGTFLLWNTEQDKNANGFFQEIEIDGYARVVMSREAVCYAGFNDAKSSMKLLDGAARQAFLRYVEGGKISPAISLKDLGLRVRGWDCFRTEKKEFEIDG